MKERKSTRLHPGYKLVFRFLLKRISGPPFHRIRNVCVDVCRHSHRGVSDRFMGGSLM